MKVDFADVLDLPAVDSRRYLLFPVLAKDRLHLAGELQTDPCTGGGFDREVRTFTRSHAAEKRDVIIFLRRESVVVDRDAVVYDMQSRHALAARQPRSDRHVVDVRMSRVLLRQGRFVRMMHGHERGHIGEMRQRDACSIVEMHDVGGQRGIAHRPRSVVQILQLCTKRIMDGPIGVRVPRLDSTGKARIAVRVDDDLVTSGVEACREVRDE